MKILLPKLAVPVIIAVHGKGGIVLKPTRATENYLETILLLKKKNGAVRSVDIANELGYSRPTVSVAMNFVKPWCAGGCGQNRCLSH